MERYLPDDIVQYIIYLKEVNIAKIEFDNVWQRLTQAWTDYEFMRRSIIDGTGDLDTDLVMVAKIVAQRTPDNMFNKYTAEKQQQLAQSGR